MEIVVSLLEYWLYFFSIDDIVCKPRVIEAVNMGYWACGIEDDCGCALPRLRVEQ